MGELPDSETERLYPAQLEQYVTYAKAEDDESAGSVAREIQRRAHDDGHTMLALVWGLSATVHEDMAKETNDA